MLKQKPNPFVLPMTVILIIALVVFSLLLVRTASELIFKTLDDTTVIEVNSISVAAPFDYTRDRDQYWQPTIALEAFDYTRDQAQYEVTYFAAPFDYTRDRQQYETTYTAPVTAFDYTRDRDQYWNQQQP